MSRRGIALPLIAVSLPDDVEIEAGGWYDPFVAGFCCTVVPRLGDVRVWEESQSVASFAATFKALFEAYQGKCVCIGCDTVTVDMLDLNSGVVIGTFNQADYGYHRLVGCGVCPACANHPGLKDRATRGFERILRADFGRRVN